MSTIEWTSKTWNPVRGCSIVSKGCRSCYAMKQAHRFSGPGGKYEGLTIMTNGGPVWSGDIRLVPEKLIEPLHWKKPRMVFVNSMSDLFHESVSFDFLAECYAVMVATWWHTFQVLTKRPKRRRTWLVQDTFRNAVAHRAAAHINAMRGDASLTATANLAVWNRGAVPNIWEGVSVEDQETADERIPLLLQTPAAVRFVSYEPALGPVTFTGISSVPACFNPFLEGRYPRLDWVIVGGESGPKARPFDITWARSTVEQCRGAGVPVFIKQLGARPYEKRPADGGPHGTHEALRAIGRPHPQCNWYKDWTLVHTPDGESNWYKHLALANSKGGDMAEWPEELRVREFPEPA